MIAKGLMMKHFNLLFLFSFLFGCASNQAFDAEQQSLISQHKIVVQTNKDDMPFRVHSRSGKVGMEVSKVVLGVLLGSYGGGGSGDTPRTRFQKNSPLQALTEAGRKNAGGQLDIPTPTQAIQQLLAEKFDVISDSETSNEQLTITSETVAWHLYYDKLLKDQQTYLLEYAADIAMSLPSEKLKRRFPCDKQSDQALTQEEWLANDQLRIRQFTDEVANNCVTQILTELGLDKVK